jgi:hypothetical protein
MLALEDRPMSRSIAMIEKERQFHRSGRLGSTKVGPGISAIIVCLIGLSIIAPTAGATANHERAAVTCPSPNLRQVLGMLSEIPKGSPHILSVWWTFSNLEDLEIDPYYWALDNGSVSLQAWQAPDGSFYVLEAVGLLWQTYAGALSPAAGVVEPQNGLGPEVQASFLHFTGTFTPGSMPTRGSLGTIDLGGTRADILKAPGPQTGGTSESYDPFFPVYFNGLANFVPTQGTLAEIYLYFPTGQVFCGTFGLFTGTVSYAGDIVT